MEDTLAAIGLLTVTLVVGAPQLIRKEKKLPPLSKETSPEKSSVFEQIIFNEEGNRHPLEKLFEELFKQ